MLRDRGDGRVAVNRRAILSRAFGQRLRQVGGLDIAIIRMLDRADHAVHIGKRPYFLDLIGREEVDVDTNRPRNPGIIMIFIHPVFGCC